MNWGGGVFKKKKHIHNKHIVPPIFLCVAITCYICQTSRSENVSLLNHFYQKGDQSVCRRRRVADGELRQRRRQGEQADFGFRVRLRIRGPADPAFRILP